MLDLRLGYIAEMYTSFMKLADRSQLEILDEWFPGLLVQKRENAGKEQAEYRDYEFMIYVSEDRGRLYSGGSTRISQITGRLIGTAKGNQEKERKTAELIRKHLANVFVTDLDVILDLQENVMKHLRALEDREDDFGEIVLRFVCDLAVRRSEMDEYEKMSEPFPMDDECFEGILYNAAYQLNLYGTESLANAYLWLLLGGLLRNESGRLLRLYDSSFVPVHRQTSDNGTLIDKINYLFFPEEYESCYKGDDLDKRFPGIEWYCDNCLDHLNDQAGFDDHLPAWQCRKCNYINILEADHIYQGREDAMNGIRETDAGELEAAILRRKEELEQ